MNFGVPVEVDMIQLEDLEGARLRADTRDMMQAEGSVAYDSIFLNVEVVLIKLQCVSR